jgi:hypothetical protein
LVEPTLVEVVKVVEVVDVVDELDWVVAGFKGTNATAAPTARMARIATPAKSGMLRSMGVPRNHWWLRLIARTPCSYPLEANTLADTSLNRDDSVHVAGADKIYLSSDVEEAVGGAG